MAKVLYVFAHPDDETVACGGSIFKLCQAGHQVRLVCVTDGSGGEVVTAAAENKVKKLGSVGAVRRQELQAAAELLGVEKVQILAFEDGTISNQEVWGELLTAIKEVIDDWQPQVVVTFDHTGWYYHLDHIGTSIATTLAVQQVPHRPDFFFHSLMPSHPQKWHYVYAPTLPVTHVVNITDVSDQKRQAIECHNSQNLHFPKEILAWGPQQYELYQLISEVSDSPLKVADLFFEPVTSLAGNQVINQLITCPK